MRKKLRQLAALLFAFVVGAGSIVYADTDAVPAEEAVQKTSVLETLPEEGALVHGFTVTGISDYLPKQAKVISMEHEKSGAKLLWIACDDPDKAFNVYYRTDAADNKGLPHVFEHITLSGSGKYPSPNLWDEMSEGLYQTYMNAQTYQHMTGYKMSSLSEDQLLLIMDFYMDGLTDPLALRDEHPLMREAYRFELESPEDEISVTGAVFNEMESVNAAPASALYSTVQRLLYPGSSMSFNTGGVRDDIITISIDELKRFYTAFYHPSNMLILMYGDMDYTRFLEALDRDYLSRYEKKDIRITDDGYIPWTGSTEALVSLPVSKDASSETGGMTAYAVSLGDIGDYDLALMSGVVSLLGSDDSPLTIRMEKDFPGASFSCELVNDTREPYVIFTLLDAENGTREAFRDAVRETVLEMAEQGFSPERTEALVNRVKMAGLLEAEQYGGLGLCEAAALSWARHGEPLSFLDAVAANLNLEEEAEKGSFDRLLAEYLTEPVRSVLVRMEPEPGLQEARDNAFRQKLLDKKEAMTEAEIAGLIGKTKEFKTWSDLCGENSLLSLVRAVRVEDLPETEVRADISDTTEDGIRFLTAALGADYLSSGLWLDAGPVGFDELHEYVFLGELLGSLGAGDRTAEALATATGKTMYTFSAGAAFQYDAVTGLPHPYFAVGSLVLAEHAADAAALTEDILFRTDFSDTARIRQLASSAATNMAFGYQNSPSGLAIELGVCAAEPEVRGLEYYSMGLPYLSFLRSVASMNEEELKALAAREKAVLEKLLNRNGLVVTAAGSEEAVRGCVSHMKALAESFSSETPVPAELSDALSAYRLPLRTAAAVNNAVSFNGIVCANPLSGLASDGKNEVVLNLLHSSLLYPAFRYDIGAYGVKDRIGEKDSYILSYRDPVVSPSFRFLEALPEKIEALSVTQEEVDDAILSVYSTYAYPLSPLVLAGNEFDYRLRNKPQSYADERLAKMRAARAVTPEDVPESAGLYRAFVEKGARITVGSQAAIEENRELYDTVITDLLR